MLTVLDGTTDGSPFGYGFFPGAVALVTWTAAASIAAYRSTATWCLPPPVASVLRRGAARELVAGIADESAIG